MNNIHKYTTKSGLEITYVYKENFKTSYCGIGTKFGGSNLNFYIDDNKISLRPGSAHFIEHQKFKLENNMDAMKLFNEMFVVNNAYTQPDKTIYFIKTTADIIEPLKLLINMFFNIHFTKDTIEFERSIIKSEKSMTIDNVGYRILSKIQNLSYPNDDFSKDLLGEFTDIDTINYEDLCIINDAFYTPNNSKLCIISSINPEIIFNIIEEELSNIKFKNYNVVKMPIVSSNNSLLPQVIKENVYQNELYLTIRLDEINSKDSISCDKLLMILDSLFNVTSDFYKYLLGKKLFINDIDYEVHTFNDSSYILINAPSKKPKKLAGKIIEKIKQLCVEDLDNKIINLNIKRLISEEYLDEDNPSKLGDKILSLALEDIDYYQMHDKILNLNIDEIKEYIKYFNNSKITYLIVKPK